MVVSGKQKKKECLLFYARNIIFNSRQIMLSVRRFFTVTCSKLQLLRFHSAVYKNYRHCTLSMKSYHVRWYFQNSANGQSYKIFRYHERIKFGSHCFTYSVEHYLLLHVKQCFQGFQI